MEVAKSKMEECCVCEFKVDSIQETTYKLSICNHEICKQCIDATQYEFPEIVCPAENCGQ